MNQLTTAWDKYVQNSPVLKDAGPTELETVRAFWMDGAMNAAAILYNQPTGEKFRYSFEQLIKEIRTLYKEVQNDTSGNTAN